MSDATTTSAPAAPAAPTPAPEAVVAMPSVDLGEIVRRLVKYILEGSAVAIAAYYIPRKKMRMQEIMMIAITAAAVFAVLDLASPSIAQGARLGAGFGIGMQQVA